MATNTCLARADTPRAVLALVFPIGAVAALFFILKSKGYEPLDYFSLLQSGALSWWRTGIGWLCFVIWIVRYYPPAWTAVWDGPCILVGNDTEVIFPGGKRVVRGEIVSVHLQRGLLRKVAHFQTTSARISLPLIFVRPSSDAALRGLAMNGG
jgi:hypothetical protein